MGAIDAWVQGLATVVAVIVGYGLSVLSERRGWERRKVEQLRDKQISAVVELCVNLQKIRDACNAPRVALQNTNSQPHVASSVAAQQSVLLQRKLTGSQWLERIADFKGNAERRVLELRLLGFGDPGLGLATRCVEAIDEVERSLREWCGADELMLPTRFDAAVTAVSRLESGLIESAIESLNG